MLHKSIHSPEHDRLAALLRQLREDAEVRQVDLAEALGKPQSFVSKVESGERRLDLLELRTYCEALDVSLVDFVGRFEAGTPSRRSRTRAAPEPPPG